MQLQQGVRSCKIILFIVNDSTYSGRKNLQRCSFRHQYERRATARNVDNYLNLFCFSDAILCGIAGQNPNEGFNIQQLIDILAAQGAEIKLCTSCVKARGLLDAKLIDGVTLGTLDDVSEWTLWADKVLTF